VQSLVNRAFAMMDEIFLVFFARRRRSLGDDHIEVAWRRATHSVTMYFGLSLLAVLFALFAAANVVLDLNVPRTHKLTWQIAAAAICLFASLLLEQRFDRFLSRPPRLPDKESPSESALVRWYRVTTVGLFLIACFGAYLLSQLGLGL
jgi:hypothetical protein